jgi:hypothetical protein
MVRTRLADTLFPERDSVKDEAVVFIFIFATAGLLLWALAKPYIEKWFVVSAPTISIIRPSTHVDIPSSDD